MARTALRTALRMAALALCCAAGCKRAATAPPPVPPFLAPGAGLTFESGPVRPLALSADGARLFAVNIPDGHLEVFRVLSGALTPEASVPVGVEPVAVAVRSPGEVWVVNHLSDSVSVVDVSSSPPRVVRTLLVGDEPSDIVFAGPGRSRAFITTAHRGQQRDSPSLAGVPGAGDPQLTTPGVGRADVWVFDAASPGEALGGRPLAIVTLRGDTPRGLAVSSDGATVYAAVFKSGNQTTVTNPLLPCPGFDDDHPCVVEGTVVPGSALGPSVNHAGVPAPRVSVMVKADAAGAFRDGRGRDWSQAIKFTLPDEDVFALDASTLATGAVFSHVGTTLFNLAVNPVSGAVYVSNTESRNDLRFEGPGTFAKTTLQGHLAESRITVLSGGQVKPRHLNKHLDYSALPASPAQAQHSLASPLDLVVSKDGKTLYVAAFGSSKVGVFPVAALEDDSFDPTKTSAGYLSVSGGGPGGLALDDARGLLYVATRFDDGLSVVDLATGKETAHLKLYDPESAKVRAGRRFLYDATVSSANGEASCASCHMFGDTDHLAWDLGNPDADVMTTPVNVKLGQTVRDPTLNGTGKPSQLHPMKGPMATQTLRGMVNHGTMHWRGDRADGFFGADKSSGPPYDSKLAFKNFIVAFNGLLGKGEQLDPADMEAFAGFALSMVLPPNPQRRLDNSLTDAQARGKRYYLGCDGLDSVSGRAVSCGPDGLPVGSGHFSDGIGVPGLGFTCNGCHTLSPADGYFGTDGQMSFEALPQTMKVPHLRNLYQKVGMFGVAKVSSASAGDASNLGPQVRGFGFSNEGSVDTLERFLLAQVFEPGAFGHTGFEGGDGQRRDVEQWLLAFDTDLAPVVGQQVTLDAANAAVAGPRLDLLRARALAPFASKVLGPAVTECDLAAHGVVAGRMAAFALRADGAWETDDGGPPLPDAALRALAAAPGQALTFTCLPPGWGVRTLDRDLDGVKNGLDRCPADPFCQ